MLDLHKEILLQIKKATSSSETQSDSGVVTQKRFRHGRINSAVSTEGVVTKNSNHANRPSKDFSWFGRPKKIILMTTPGEAADIARMFEGMVWLSTVLEIRCLY